MLLGVVLFALKAIEISVVVVVLDDGVDLCCGEVRVVD
jgi:hypothetical protein